jgi:hypothetical protein
MRAVRLKRVVGSSRVRRGPSEVYGHSDTPGPPRSGDGRRVSAGARRAARWPCPAERHPQARILGEGGDALGVRGRLGRWTRSRATSPRVALAMWETTLPSTVNARTSTTVPSAGRQAAA